MKKDIRIIHLVYLRQNLKLFKSTCQDFGEVEKKYRLDLEHLSHQRRSEN